MKCGETMWLGDSKQEASTWTNAPQTEGRGQITCCCQNNGVFPSRMTAGAFRDAGVGLIS